MRESYGDKGTKTEVLTVVLDFQLSLLLDVKDSSSVGTELLQLDTNKTDIRRGR
jgi:hypothetical protein